MKPFGTASKEEIEKLLAIAPRYGMSAAVTM